MNESTTQIELSCPSCQTMMAVPMTLETDTDTMPDFIQALLQIEAKYSFHCGKDCICPKCGKRIIASLTVTSHKVEEE
jgi:hypothetical protein